MFENCKSYSFFTGEISSAGLSQSSFEYMCNKYPNYQFVEGVDRNVGLIGITKKDIEDTRKGEEGRITIDLDKEIIDAGWMLDYIETEEYINEYTEEDESNYDEIPVFLYNDLNEISFSKLKKVINTISKYEKKGIYAFKSKDGTEVIRLIV